MYSILRSFVADITKSLPAESIVRPSKIATFEETSFVRHVGTLAVTNRKAVSAQLRELLCVEKR
jgi:hypothetical protein